MADRPPSPRLSHTIKFRLAEADYDRLARQAEAHRMRVNEFARRMVVEHAPRAAATPALDPALVIALQDIGVRLREMRNADSCPPELCEKINGLCHLIEGLLDHALAGGPASWFR